MPNRPLTRRLLVVGAGAQVYEFVFDKERGKWVPWTETIESKKPSPEAEYSNIIVPTVRGIRAGAGGARGDLETWSKRWGCCAAAPCLLVC